MTNYNEDEILEAGDHPEDSKSALEYDLGKNATDVQYDGQSLAFSRNPAAGELRAEPEQDAQVTSLLEEEEQEETTETNNGIDVIR